MARASRATMHAISYQLKRAHLCAVAIGRRIFRGTKKIDDPDFDGIPHMTPARFDILYLVFGKRIGCYRPDGIGMATIVRTLGLARATISKAIKRLVELGIVTCDHVEGNARDKWVSLTKLGHVLIRRAIHLVFTGRALSRHYRRLISVSPTQGKQAKRKNFPAFIDSELCDILYELGHIARHHFDTSLEIYYRRGDWDA